MFVSFKKANANQGNEAATLKEKYKNMEMIIKRRYSYIIIKKEYESKS